VQKDRSREKSVSIVGAGRLAHALARNLTAVGWKVSSIVVRKGKHGAASTRGLAAGVGATVETLGGKNNAARLVWICVPDSAIAEVAQVLARSGRWRGQTVFHSSGALTSDELKPLGDKGAKVASVHPGMTFVRESKTAMGGVPFGIEGDAGALRLAREVIGDIGGTAVKIPKEKKALYHAFDTFASPMLVALMAALERVGKAAGIPEKEIRTMAGPLLRQTLENYLQHGAEAAFTGAFVRGDEGVVRKHVDALREVPLAREAYLALARVAMEHLPVKNRGALSRALMAHQAEDFTTEEHRVHREKKFRTR
jgi:predicted short-subunit dehydrogenase-like oxidoreductase (DUF2520 family)